MHTFSYREALPNMCCYYYNAATRICRYKDMGCNNNYKSTKTVFVFHLKRVWCFLLEDIGYYSIIVPSYYSRSLHACHVPWDVEILKQMVNHLYVQFVPTVTKWVFRRSIYNSFCMVSHGCNLKFSWCNT